MGKLAGWALLIAWILPTVAHAAPTTYQCTFPQVFILQEGLGTQDFSFKLAYDKLTHTAFMVGNVGISPMMVHEGSMAVSFMELTGSGVVQTLTLLRSGEAVYSRHSPNFGGAGFFASQQYGTCTPID